MRGCFLLVKICDNADKQQKWALVTERNSCRTNDERRQSRRRSLGPAVAENIEIAPPKADFAMNHHDRIVIDPDIQVGKPVVKGTRLSVEFLLGLLAQ